MRDGVAGSLKKGRKEVGAEGGEAGIVVIQKLRELDVFYDRADRTFNLCLHLLFDAGQSSLYRCDPLAELLVIRAKLRAKRLVIRAKLRAKLREVAISLSF